MKIYRNLVLNINDVKVDKNLMPKEKLNEIFEEIKMEGNNGSYTD